MTNLTIAVIVKNEEKRLAGCLETLRWADELLVLDTGSTDRTLQVARTFTAQVHQRPFTTFARVRNAAIDLAHSEWVLFVDADERVTPELAREIRDTVQGISNHAGYWIPRRNLILGRWMRHTGWWPDHQLRLFRRETGRYDESKDPHEVLTVSGRVAYLQEPLLHYNYVTFSQIYAKQNLYSTLEARNLLQRGVRARPQNFFLQPLREFQRRYLTLEGYKDGLPGLFMSLVMATYVLAVYLKLSKLQMASGCPSQSPPL